MAKSRHNDFNITPVVRSIDRKMKTIPRKMGRIALEHFDNSFRNQGFTDTTLQTWKKTKSGKTNTFGRKPHHAILIGTGRLRRGNRMAAITDRMVRIVNDVPYAQAHNEGVHETVRVSTHTREVSTFSYNIRTRSRNKKPVGKREVIVQAHNRRMNLPRRRFMGTSRMMNKEIEQMIVREVNQAFKHF